MSTPTIPKLWTQEDLSEFADLTMDQVRYLRRSGKGPAFTKIGKEIRYIPGVVHRWVLDRQQLTTKAS